MLEDKCKGFEDGREKDYSCKKARLIRHGVLCPVCKQNVLSPDLKIFKGPPKDAFEEEAALTHDRLRLYIDDGLIPDADGHPQNKITHFDVFDQEGHLCPFDQGLIESNQFIYFSGYIKPIYDDDPSTNNSVPAHELGPINQWWISGFDGGNNFIIALTTPYAEYILMEPSPDYKSFMRLPRQKALLTKIIIEFLSTSYEPVYEELLNRLQEVTVPEGIEPFDENSLSQHAQFITDQVCEIDDDGELISTPAMQTIINLHGTIVSKYVKKKKEKPAACKLSKATLTPLVSGVFEWFFKNNESYFTYNKSPEKRDMKLPDLGRKFSEIVWEEGDDFALVNNEKITHGDFVFISTRESAKRNRIFRVEYFVKKNFTKQVHCSELGRGIDTILGESSHPCEFFFLDECSDHAICKIIGKTSVANRQCDDKFFAQKRFIRQFGRFEDVNIFPDGCRVCELRRQESEYNRPVLRGKTIAESETTYEAVVWRNVEYRPGSYVFLEPFAVIFDIHKNRRNIEKTVMTFKADESIYPEIYRKAKEVSIVDECPEPFKIGKVKNIFTKNLGSKKKIFLTILKFYRPENTHLSPEVRSSDINLLYSSEEETEVELEHVRGLCDVFCSENYPKGDEIGFYYHESYDCYEQRFTKLETCEVKIELKGDAYMRKLRTLNVFSGCGGLAEGLTQSGVAEVLWAVEIDEPTAKAFKLNHPKATVVVNDCNFFLRDIIAGKITSPAKGEVEFLCAGPPCQGFSAMNRFTAKQYSQFKNSLIATYLSFCDYYRPKFFLMENVRNFISFKKSALLKHTLGCLVAMGYQCSFGVMQAGNFGLPQTRRRLFILAAASGMTLPRFPKPKHVFSRQLCCFDLEIDGKKYVADFLYDGSHSAPYRRITIRDGIHDLLKAKDGDVLNERTVVRDHVSKEVTPLNEARIKHIPAMKDCDWRDLPNIAVLLRDGTISDILKYEYHDRKNGKSQSGLMRGVCPCATGSSCDPLIRQNNTLIPWCLSHTANRNNNWSGLYGRLNWNGVFSTTITNPEPSCKQGRVLHPQEDRIITIRESARSQGLPDTFKFSGTIMERYRQVGNAVPPPLAKAFGEEIKKSLLKLS